MISLFLFYRKQILLPGEPGRPAGPIGPEVQKKTQRLAILA